MVTVFTPTYNRRYRLENLYKSLCRQTSKDFEWLIVDDGSTDGTNELVDIFIKDNKFDIRYFHKQNEGKHIAINHGVEKARGDLFFIVDSDDEVTPDAVEWILANARPIMDNPKFAGIVGQRKSPDGCIVGREVSGFGTVDVDCVTFYYKYQGRGDHAEVFKTDVLRKYPFPKVEGERFCSESVVWFKIAEDYVMRYIEHPIYVVEYLDDGLSHNCMVNKLKNPNYSMMQSEMLYKHPGVSAKDRIKAGANYWRYAAIAGQGFGKSLKRIGAGALWLYPLGIALYFKSRKYLKNK